MNTAALLTIYCGLIVAASLLGGWIPHVVRLTHRRLEIAISFVAGVILGIGLLHLLPHAIEALPEHELEVMVWVLAGFLVMFFCRSLLSFPSSRCAHRRTACRVPGRRTSAPRHAHGDAQAREHAHEPTEHDAPRLSHATFSWGGAAIGLALHSLIEGLALAAGVAAEVQENPLAHWAGLGIFLAIVLHKPFDSLTVGTLMAASGWSPRHRQVVNALFALIVPCGVLGYLATAGPLVDSHGQALGRALGFAAGAFVCIASSDLLPECCSSIAMTGANCPSHSCSASRWPASSSCSKATAIRIIIGKQQTTPHPMRTAMKRQPTITRGRIRNTSNP